MGFGDSRLRVKVLELRVLGPGFEMRVKGFEFRVLGLEFGVQGSGFRVWRGEGYSMREEKG